MAYRSRPATWSLPDDDGIVICAGPVVKELLTKADGRNRRDQARRECIRNGLTPD
jgi:hypothetical protein